MSHPATAEEITALLGEVDPIVVKQILEVGASFDEIAEALSAIEDEADYGELQHPPSTEHVVAVRGILEPLVLDEREDDEALPVYGP